LVSAAITLSPKNGTVTFALRFEKKGSGESKTIPDKEEYAREPLPHGGTVQGIDKGPRFVVLEMTHSGPGFDKADAKKMNNETFSFNPNGEC